MPNRESRKPPRAKFACGFVQSRTSSLPILLQLQNSKGQVVVDTAWTIADAEAIAHSLMDKVERYRLFCAKPVKPYDPDNLLKTSLQIENTKPSPPAP